MEPAIGMNGMDASAKTGGLQGVGAGEQVPPVGALYIGHLLRSLRLS